MRQRGPTARLKQTSQWPTVSLTSRIASANGSASSVGRRRMWNASRCAVRWPTPGMRESSAIRRLTGGANTAGARTVLPGVLQAWEAEAAEPARTAEPSGRGVHPVGGQLLRRAERLVGRGKHEILQHLDVLGVHGLGVDPDLLELELAGHLHGDHAAPGARLHHLVLQLLLSLQHLGLHLLDLLHHLVHVRLLGHADEATPPAPRRLPWPRTPA